MRSIRQIYNPGLSQGSFRKRNYFEGWYFKHVSAGSRHAFAVIPGVSLSEDAHSFIQYIDGNTGATLYFRYSPDEIRFNSRIMEIKVGNSYFSEKEINLDIENDGHRLSGKITYSDINHFPGSIFRPGIMGWYSFVPGMECNHGVVSTGHTLTGKISADGLVTDYSGGRGYIEKDWGTSFPESWIWLQCNNFGHDDVSVMISVAKIPWRGSWFMGFISFLRIRSRTYVFATYNGAKVTSLRRTDDITTLLTITRGALTLTATVKKKGSGTLRAPSDGMMSGTIRESLNSEVELSLTSGKDIIFSGTGMRAGYEETEKIFSYFSQA